MRSSATEELLDDRPHLGLDDGRRTRRVDQPHALGLGATDLEIAPAHPAVEGERFALEAVQAPAAKPPLEPHQLGGLARPFDALERDQYAAHAPEPPGATIARGSGAREPRRAEIRPNPAWSRGGPMVIACPEGGEEMPEPSDLTRASAHPFVRRVDKPWGWELHFVPEDWPYMVKIL